VLSAPNMVDPCVKELELCGVREGETVAVLSQGDERMDYANAFLAAARLGATPFHVPLPDASTSLAGEVGAWTVGSTPLADNRPAVEALKQADLLIDTIFLLFSKEQLEIQESGTRILLCIEPIEHLREMFPTRTCGGASRRGRSYSPARRRSGSSTRRGRTSPSGSASTR
jgi:2,5-dihydroxypyridine 5,6-dioxygenase